MKAYLWKKAHSDSSSASSPARFNYQLMAYLFNPDPKKSATYQVSLWYTDHSTPNPFGVVPDPHVTRVVVGDKFSEEGVELVDEQIQKMKKKHKKHKHE